METIRSLNTYKTDTYGSQELGGVSRPSDWTYSQVLDDAIGMNAKVIVKPSRDNWYIKGINNNNKSYDEIKSHLEINEERGYKNKSLSRLLSYF